MRNVSLPLPRMGDAVKFYIDPAARIDEQHRVHIFDAAACSCQHEDWQHTISSTCAGGKTGGSCPCSVRWHEAGWEVSER